MGKWKTCTIADIGTVVGGATPSTKKSENYDGGTIAWITPKDLASFHNRYISSGKRNITETGLKSCSAKLLPVNTVLFSSRAPIGYVAIAKNQMCTNQGFKSVIPNNDTDPLFLYYLLKYNKDKIENMSSGTTFKEVSGKAMKSFQVCVPMEIKEQEKIGHLLGVLDDKIEENERINQNLEQQMDALYNDYFITKADPLWTIGTINDLGDVVGGGTPSKKNDSYYTKEGIAWVTPKDLSQDHSKFFSHGATDITDLGLSKSSAVMLPAGSVLFSSRAPVGYIAITANELCTNQGFKSVVPHKDIGTAFVYCFLKANLSVIENMASGSTFKEVSGSTMKNIPAVIPDNRTLVRFNDIVTPLLYQQRTLELENRRLASIRDSLLPRLMSGQLDVSGINV